MSLLTLFTGNEGHGTLELRHSGVLITLAMEVCRSAPVQREAPPHKRTRPQNSRRTSVPDNASTWHAGCTLLPNGNAAAARLEKLGFSAFDNPPATAITPLPGGRICGQPAAAHGKLLCSQ